MFLLINKPPNITSHDVVNKLRQITGQKRIGHAGTLDPFATGLLIVALGRESTKKLDQFLKLDKTYQATLQLGAVSDTYDKTGKIKTISNQQSAISKAKIIKTLNTFIGLQFQVPPQFSAKKINGQKAYQLARSGKIVKLKPQKIVIYNIKLKEFKIKNFHPAGDPPTTRMDYLQGNLAEKFKIEVHCSSGTYIRSLAHDVGQKLDGGAYLEKLRRTQIGTFKLKDAISLNKLTKNNWQKFTLANLPLPHKTRALVFGTFDKLHPGHRRFLAQAKKLADELYVVVARDVNVKKIKGHWPNQAEIARLKNLKNANLATEVMLGSIDIKNRCHIINKIKPDIIALGYDQKINMTELKAKLKKYKLNPAIIRLKPYHPEKYKSSLI